MRKWIPLTAVLLGTFMLLVDVTIVNVALPTVAHSLHTSFSSLQWVVDAYALALAALLLGVGALADGLGHRRVYVGGLVLFAVSSLVCGLAPNAGALIAARAVQGIGGAAMFATVFPLINRAYAGRDRGIAYGLWGSVAGASAAIGPVLGGLLVEGFSWRWVFFVNLPVSVLALVMCARAVPADTGARRFAVDLPGATTFTVAAAALTLGLIRTGDHGWGAGTYLLLALSAVSLAVFVAIETRVPDPLIDLSLFRNSSFVGVMVAALLLNLTAFSVLTYTSIWLQSVIGLSPIEAGLTGLPLAGVALVVSGVLGRFLHKAAPGPIISGGLLLIGLGGLVSAVILKDGSSWPALVPGYVLIGAGVGLATPTLASAVMSAVAPQKGGMAAGAVNTMRQLGYALGIAILGSVVAAGAASSLRSSAGVTGGVGSTAHALVGGQAPVLLAHAGTARSALDHALRIAEVHGLVRGLLVVGVTGVVTAGAVFALMRRPVAVVAPAAPKAVPVR
jgi:EmrB/QacA subfamily drug resistance transporter